jgi:hypothetical protein
MKAVGAEAFMLPVELIARPAVDRSKRLFDDPLFPATNVRLPMLSMA